MREHIGVNDGIGSLASAAVSLGDRECDLEVETALVVGDGESGLIGAKAVAEWADHVIVANRTVPHAEHVADKIDVETSTVGLNALETAVSEARVVVSATGSNTQVFDVGTFAEAGETVVVDIAQPRDVPTGTCRIPSVTVYDLDSVELLTQKTQDKRRFGAQTVEQLVASEFDHMLTKYKRKRAHQVISAMYESAERVKTAELTTAMTGADFDESQREAVESMANAIVSQLLAAPTKGLRRAAEEDDWSTIQTAVALFDTDSGHEPLESVQRLAPEDTPEGRRDPIQPAVLERLADD